MQLNDAVSQNGKRPPCPLGNILVTYEVTKSNYGDSLENLFYEIFATPIGNLASLTG